MSRPLTRGLDPNLPAAPDTPDGEARHSAVPSTARGSTSRSEP